jgi:N-acetylglutamate synthase-like GNAT family acetyltransferase
VHYIWKDLTVFMITHFHTSKGTIQIRNRFWPGDIGAIIHQHGKYYHLECGYGIGFETYVAEGLIDFYKHFDPDKDRVWICEHDSQVVGTLVLAHREHNSAQLRYFLIHPDYRKLKLGKKLMQLFMDCLKENFYTHAYLWTTSELNTAARLYSRFGFSLTESKKSAFFGKEVVEQRYDWQL